LNLAFTALLIVCCVTHLYVLNSEQQRFQKFTSSNVHGFFKFNNLVKYQTLLRFKTRELLQLVNVAA